MKVLLPDVMPLSPDLPAECECVVYDAKAPIPPEHRDAEVLVAWGVSGQWLKDAAAALPNVRLVQGLLAGPDTIRAAGFGPDVALCGGAGLHSRTVTEHALAMILHLVRQVPQALAAQREHRWASEIGGERELHPAGPITALIDANVLIWGFGSIGQTLAPILASLGARVRGVARSAGARAGFEVIAEADVDSALPGTDLLVMILPASAETTDALDARRMALLGPDAFVVNVGRGVTIDEEALVAVLRSGGLAGAALDVAKTEPLPADSPLWDAPGLFLTPHAAGGRPIGADELIARNVRALLAGEPFANSLT